MNAAIKYTLGRFVLFLVVFALLLPVPMNFLVKAMIALVASAGFGYFLLARWRNEMAEALGSAQERRQAERTRLRAALAGDEEAAAAGDRATSPASTSPAPSASASSSSATPSSTPSADDAQ